MMRQFAIDNNVLSRAGSSLGVFGLASGLPVPLHSPADTVWPVANLAIYIPIRVVVPTMIVNIALSNGTVVAGNTDVGIYAEDGTRIIASGSTAMSGTSALQLFNVTDTLIGPGLYYLAVAHSETTAEYLRYTHLNAFSWKVAGVAEQTSAFPLPATATFATSTNNYVPVMHCGTKGSGII